MAEITSADYPGERLIACYNPFLAAERARKRGELLDATEAELKKIDAATRRARRPLRGKDAIALAVGKVINNKKVAKHFITEITDGGLAWQRVAVRLAAWFVPYRHLALHADLLQRPKDGTVREGGPGEAGTGPGVCCERRGRASWRVAWLREPRRNPCPAA
jgi:hypothetical protein